MSIINSIANCKNSFNNGAHREVFYSKKYDCVIKKEREYMRSHLHTGEQCEQEKYVFDTMTDEEKEIFPVIDVIEYKGSYVFLMKRCQMLEHWYNRLDFNINVAINTIDELDRICDVYGLSKKYNKLIKQFVKKYKLRDVHSGNVGIYNGHLCILDAGY